MNKSIILKAVTILDLLFPCPKFEWNNSKLWTFAELFCSEDSCQASWCWTASQQASCWAEEAGPFITGCCSSLGKWSIGSWQMWVSFIGQNDRLCCHELDVVGLSEMLQRWWGVGHFISSVYFGLVIFHLHVTFARKLIFESPPNLSNTDTEQPTYNPQVSAFDKFKMRPTKSSFWHIGHSNFYLKSTLAEKGLILGT